MTEEMDLPDGESLNGFLVTTGDYSSDDPKNPVKSSPNKF
jgi:hypothetical protein